jgi:hypothetical protein
MACKRPYALKIAAFSNCDFSFSWHATQCKEYFKTQGYRWYNLLSDAVSEKPSILFTKNFWATTLFEKAYHSKVQFEKKDFFALTNL